MTYTPVRLWIAAGVAAALLVAVVGWLTVIGPQRARAAERWDELEAAEAQSSALRTRIAALEAEFEQIDQRQAELATRREAMPTGNELQTLERIVEEAGAATGVTVESTAAGEPLDLTPEPPKPVVQDEDAEEESEEDADAEDSEQAAAVTPAAWPVYAIPVTIRAGGSLVAIQDFLRVLQSEQPRAILVSDLTIVPDLGAATLGDQVVMTAETRVFVSPEASAFGAGVSG